ncbi:porin [bacterium]|nr:porin [bacterium]
MAVKRAMRLVTALCIGAAATPAVSAQGAGEGGWTLDAELVVAFAAIVGDDGLAQGRDDWAGELSAAIERETVLASGVVVTLKGAGRVQRDFSDRGGFAGLIGSCPATVSGCPSIGSPGRALIAPATGIGIGPGDGGDDVIAGVDAASVMVSGAWGEALLGWDTGAAARLDARPPKVARAVAATSPSLDPTGLGIVRARNDLTGSSAKLTVMSPRWLGLRVGASVTPDAALEGVDFDPRFTSPGFATADLGPVWEAAASFARRFRTGDVRLRSALTYTQGEGDDRTGFGVYRAWGWGLEVELGPWAAGVRQLESNNALGGGGDYSATEAGVVREVGAWRLGAEYGFARDRALTLRGETWSLSASRPVADGAVVAFGWADGDLEAPTGFASGARQASTGGKGPFLELSVRN